jgi:hypothetical protein
VAKERGRASQKKIQELEAQVIGKWEAVQREDDLAVAQAQARAIRLSSDVPEVNNTHPNSAEGTDWEAIDTVVSEEESDHELESDTERKAKSGTAIDRQVSKISMIGPTH